MFLTDIFSFAFRFLAKPQEESKTSATIKESLVYVFFLSLFSAVISDLILFAQGSDINALIGTPILSIGAIFVQVFFSAALIHFFGKIFHYFKNGFTSTFAAAAFGNTLLALFAWVGSITLISTSISSYNISYFFLISSTFYTYPAIMNQQNVNRKQALIAVVLPTILLFVIIILLAGAAYLYISGLTPSSNVSSYQNATSAYSDTILGYKASTTGDASFCNQISANSLIGHCYFGVAMIRQDISLCSKATSTDLPLQKMCEANVQAITNRNTTFCDSLSNMGGYYDDCKINAAIINRDSNLCDSIIIVPNSGINVRNTCYSYLANILRDSSICNKINDTGISMILYTKTFCTAVTTLNPTLCSGNSYLNMFCYNIVAISKHDKSICDSEQGIYQQLCQQLVDNSISQTSYLLSN